MRPNGGKRIAKDKPPTVTLGVKEVGGKANKPSKNICVGGRNITILPIWAPRSKRQTNGYAAVSACAYGKHGNAGGRECRTLSDAE